MRDRLPIELTADADDDLADIYIYTDARYGALQAERYLSNINSAFEDLGINPELGRERADIRETLRSFPKGKHMIFYRILADRIRILRVLSAAQDVDKIMK